MPDRGRAVWLSSPTVWSVRHRMWFSPPTAPHRHSFTHGSVMSDNPPGFPLPFGNHIQDDPENGFSSSYLSVPPPPPSFPRKRESRGWLPAFAGMTKGWDLQVCNSLPFLHPPVTSTPHCHLYIPCHFCLPPSFRRKPEPGGRSPRGTSSDWRARRAPLYSAARHSTVRGAARSDPVHAAALIGDETGIIRRFSPDFRCSRNNRILGRRGGKKGR